MNDARYKPAEGENSQAELSMYERAMQGLVPIAKLIGFHIVEIADGRAVMEMESGPHHANVMGSLHGGVLCDFTDAAMGLAFMKSLHRHQSATTVELKINFFRPVWSSKLRAEARVVNRGKTMLFVECEVTDSKGRLICKASSTCMLIEGEKRAGR